MEEEMEDALMRIRNIDDLRIAFVGTKCDLEASVDEEPAWEIAEENEASFHIVSSKDGTGFEAFINDVMKNQGDSSEDEKPGVYEE